ncbi:MAG: efflux RND transporter periplasmic adaptor subunit [Armatimonadetes bacterium]|nr:efflux RND transporter periplasmic adaptor subunit [Armatimonadota bacterium]
MSTPNTPEYRPVLAALPAPVVPASPASRRKKVRTAATLLLASATLGAAGMMAGNRAESNTASQEKPPAPEAASLAEVVVQPAALGMLRKEIRVTGTLKSDEVVTLSTKATGLVRRVAVREGDRVRAGQLLVQIDDGELQAQLAKARAAVLAAEARVKQSVTSRTVKDTAAVSDYRRAQQGLSSAKSRLAQARELSKISATETESAVASARAALQSAKEGLKVRREGARRQEKARAEMDVVRAQAQMEKAKSYADRREQLVREGAIGQEEADNARRDYEVALALYHSAKQGLDLMNEGSRTEEINIAEEAVRQAEAALRTAEANRARRRISDEDVIAAENGVRQAEATLDAARAALGQKQVSLDDIGAANAALTQARADVQYYHELLAQTRVFSPVDGVVTKRIAHVGETVAAGRGDLMTLVATDTLYFEATTPEGDLPYLSPGQAAKVTLDAMPGKAFAGAVREIIPVAEGANRSVRLRISLPRPEGTNPVVGGFARATIQSSSKAPVLTVPRSALVSDEGEQAVFVAENGKAKWTPVRTNGGGTDRLQILSGLKPGAAVVTEGAESLTDGQKVALKDGE